MLPLPVMPIFLICHTRIRLPAEKDDQSEWLLSRITVCKSCKGGAPSAALPACSSHGQAALPQKPFRQDRQRCDAAGRLACDRGLSRVTSCTGLLETATAPDIFPSAVATLPVTLILWPRPMAWPKRSFALFEEIEIRLLHCERATLPVTAGRCGGTAIARPRRLVRR